MSSRSATQRRLEWIGTAIAGGHRPPKIDAISAAIAAVADRHPPITGKPSILVQGAEDPFYLVLFSALAIKLAKRGLGCALVVPRGVSGSVGAGWLHSIHRSAPVAWLKARPWVEAYGAACRQRVGLRCNTWGYPVGDARDYFASLRIWRGLTDARDLDALHVHGLHVGDLVIDSYLRFRPSPRLDLTDPFLFQVIWSAHCVARRAVAFFARSNGQCLLTSYTTYIEHGVPARAALAAGAAVWSFGTFELFAKRLSPTDAFHTKNCQDYRAAFDALDDQDRRLSEADGRMKARLQGQLDTATAYMRVSAYASRSAFDVEAVRGAVVIFLHDFYDSPHVYRDLVFSDFWSWACFTIETLQAAGHRVAVKPHPNQIAEGRSVVGDLAGRYRGVQILDANVNNVQLAEAGIVCGVTVYGTIAQELAYLGVPVLACAEHPHASFGFCRTARTLAEYRALLAEPTRTPLTKPEMKRQALAFYYMHNLADGPRDHFLRVHFADLYVACSDPDDDGTKAISMFDTLMASLPLDDFVDDFVRTRFVGGRHLEKGLVHVD
jgi:hypothetical protein